MIPRAQQHRASCLPRALRAQGAVILLVCFFLLFLLGFMGIALDFGHMFVVKTELQTAMDSCALAAAQELDGQATALTRAANAGMTAANANRVNLQSTSWDGKAKVTVDEINFRDAAYITTAVPANARYAQCQHTQTGVRMWLLQAMGAFNGNTAANPSTRAVLARAVATRGSSQTTCPIPVGLRPKVGGVAPNYGYQIGEWVTVFGNKVPGSGEMGWYNLDGSKSASETAAELAEGGYCGTRVGDTLGTPGAQISINTPWNIRFGIYKNTGDPSQDHPDATGYAYTSVNWKNAVPQNAFSGTKAAGSDPTAANYITKRAAFASFDDTGISLKDGAQIVFGDKNILNGFQKLATPGLTGQHQQYGYSRRLVTVPILSDTYKVVDYACMFMLDPLTGPQGDAHMEFLGNSASAASPCTTNGMPGGTAGPLIPLLVR
jgi:Flp pilus assembly protein TadG